MVETVLCVGMAGSGKTTFMQRLNCELHAAGKAPYVLNLDPAVHEIPYGANIDIRDSINYKKVMSDYNLGPNGAIMTCLNLFATKIDQVIALTEKRAPDYQHMIVDTPGQIEAFIWSASGQIITDSFASAFPTMIAFIVDTPRCTSPSTFMSNMLYACSILYKTKLPMIIVFNKTDVEDAGFAMEWMQDFEAFQQSLKLDDDENGSGYMGSLMSSMSLMLEEFYKTLDFCAVSSMTGKGFSEFIELVSKKGKEFEIEYSAEKERVKKVKEERAKERKAKDLERVLKDVPTEDGALSDFDDDDEGDGLEDPDDYEDVPKDNRSLEERYQDALGQ